MNFLKQLLFLLVLVSPIICGSLAIADEPPIMSMISDDRKQDIGSIVKVIGKAVESELAFINVDANADKEKKGFICNAVNIVDIDLAKVEQFLQQKLPVIVARVSNAVKHDLTKNQQTIVIDLLHNLESLSSFTKDDFVKMTKVDWEHLKHMQDEYIPEELKERLVRPTNRGEFEELILISKEIAIVLKNS